MFELKPTSLAGCVELQPTMHADNRGHFVKTVHADWFAAHGLRSDFAESFYSVSKAGVLRGLHLQLPPNDYAKLVYCMQGTVLDAIVDLRSKSPTYGQYVLIELDSTKRNQVYIPVGLAHGFYARNEAVMMYHVTEVHVPLSDAGVRWDSAGIPWPDKEPTVSVRDAKLPALARFKSPF